MKGTGESSRRGGGTALTDYSFRPVSSTFNYVQLVTHSLFPWPHTLPPRLSSPISHPSSVLLSIPFPLACPHNSLLQPSLPWITLASALLAHIDHPIPSTPTSLYLQILPPMSISLLIALTAFLPLATLVPIFLFRLPKEVTGKPPSISQAEYDNTLPTRIFCHKRVPTPNLVSQCRTLRSWVGRKASFDPTAKRSNLAIDSGTTALTPQGSKIPIQTSSNRLVCSFYSIYTSTLNIPPSATGNAPLRPLRRGQSLLGREEDVHESGLALFKRGTMRRKRQSPTDADETSGERRRCLGNIPGPHNGWVTYCYLITACAPPFLLRACGERVFCLGQPALANSLLRHSQP